MKPVNERFLTTQQVAEILGLSVSTVKRLVETNEILAVKTPGGHRRISETVLGSYAKTKGLAFTEQKKAVISDSRQDPGLKPIEDSIEYWQTFLTTSLIKSQVDDARHSVRTVYMSSGDAAILADKLIGPVMRGIGHAWEDGRIEVFQEHHACHILSDILYELVRHTRNRNRRLILSGARPLAIGCTPEGDHYTLTGMLCELTLLERCWEVRNLGCHLPIIELSHAITNLKPAIAWLSVHHFNDESQFITDLRQLRETARTMRTTLVIGGRRLTPMIRQALDQLDVIMADEMGCLVKTAEKIFPDGRNHVDFSRLQLQDLQNSR